MPRGEARPSATWPTEPSCHTHRPATKHRRLGASRTVGSPTGGGAVGGTENEVQPQRGCQPHPDQGVIPLPGWALLFPSGKWGEQTLYLTCLTLVLALVRAPHV